MTNPEILQEKYEDALFALLMHSVAQADGQKFLELNEQMKKASGNEVSPEFDQRCLSAIASVYAQRKRKRLWRTARSILIKCAVILVLISTLFITAYASFPKVRTTTLNLLIEVSDLSTRLSMSDQLPTDSFETNNNATAIAGYTLPSIMEGYKIVYRYNGEAVSLLKYENQLGSSLQFQITKGSGTNIHLDTEDANTKRLLLCGTDVMFVKKDNRLQAVWMENALLFTVTATGLTEDQFTLWVQDFLEINT